MRSRPPAGAARSTSSADGISLGEGVGCIVLKRVADAERDGDRILAVIDAVSASSDGRSLGLTAPRREGQRRALERAYDRSGVSPAAIGLVEAHGTGTVVGDRTELATLTDVFSERGAVPGSTTLGSVKSQIGHTKCAAGIAGMIKAVHALHRGVLPPTLNVDAPNEAYDPKTSPFVFGDTARPWVGDDRRAAVSAFGFGGSNFHAVLSAYTGADEPAHALDQWPAELFVVRGETPADASTELDRLAGLLDANDGAGRPWRLRDLARTQHERRRGAPVQVTIVADDVDDLAAKVVRARAGETGKGVFVAPTVSSPGDETDGVAPQVGFLFPGQGSQRPHMMGDLFVAFPALRRWLALGDDELVERMFPPAAFGEAAGQSAAALTDTRVAQPALGLAGLAMTDLLGRCGVEPGAAGGHSYGELPALVAAGALDARDLVALSRARGEAILDASPDDDPGAMAAVRGPVDDVRAALDAWPEVIVANDNAPDQSVISGPTAQVTEAAARLAELGYGTRRLPVACAFHTPRLQVAADALAAHLGDIDVAVPRFPVWSNTTAAPYGGDADDVRARLAGQVAAPVAFRQQVEAMYAAGTRVFVESGPGRVLTQLVGKILGDRPHTAVACDASGEHGIRRFLLALAELAAVGVAVDASTLFDGRDAQAVDPAAVPTRAPYLLDGSRVRTADGERVPGVAAGGARVPADHPGRRARAGGGRWRPAGARGRVPARHAADRGGRARRRPRRARRAGLVVRPGGPVARHRRGVGASARDRVGSRRQRAARERRRWQRRRRQRSGDRRRRPRRRCAGARGRPARPHARGAARDGGGDRERADGLSGGDAGPRPRSRGRAEHRFDQADRDPG